MNNKGSTFNYITANDLDQAWRNFELDLPLEPGPHGEINPFYVERPGNPSARLVRCASRAGQAPG